MSLKRWRIIILMVAILLATSGVQAAEQSLPITDAIIVPYRGQLSNAAGQPAPDGAYELQFQLFAKATGGKALWSETQPDVVVRNGLFSVELGRWQPLTSEVLDSAAERWLEVSVRGPGEASPTVLAPRQILSMASVAPAPNAASSCAHDHGGERWEVSGTWSAGLTLILQDPAITNPAGLYASDGTSYNVAPMSSGVTGVSGGGAGVVGRAQNGTGVLGMSSSGNGVSGESTDWFGVYGQGLTGVVGTSSADGSNGIFAEHTGNGIGLTAASAQSFGIQASGLDDSRTDGIGDILLAGNNGEIVAPGIVMNLFSNRHLWIDLDEDNNDAGAIYRIYGGDQTVLWQIAEPAGNAMTAGSQASIVDTKDYGQRLLYAVEGTGVWLEDIGTATLGQNGEVTVIFDPVYAQAANLEQDYQVFVTALGEQFVLLQVSSKTAEGFTVRGITLDGKPAACSFDYRVVAARDGYEDTRLEQVSLDDKE